MLTKRVLMLLSSVLLTLIPVTANAYCGFYTIGGNGPGTQRTAPLLGGFTTTARGHGGHTLTAGNAGLTGTTIYVSASETLQPIGTVLHRSTADFLTGAKYWISHYAASDGLFDCTRDLFGNYTKAYEYYALNTGNSKLSVPVAVPGIPGAYYTRHKYIALRLKNGRTGRYYTPNWQGRLLDMKQYGLFDMIVPATAFSDLEIEFIKVNNPNITKVESPYTYFGGGAQNGEPNAYIALQSRERVGTTFEVGQGIFGNSLEPDLTLGRQASFTASGFTVADSVTGFTNYLYYYPGVWKIQTTFVTIGQCRMVNYTNRVEFKTLTATDLNNGVTDRQPFDISISCGSNIDSGTSPGQVSMGLLVKSNNAIAQAKSLGLQTAGGGLTYLLDDEYNQNQSVAKGVGIQITDSSGKTVNLLTNTSQMQKSSEQGWYGYKNLLPDSGPVDSTGERKYQGKFTAELKKLPSQTATPGSVSAQLEIILRLN